MDHFRVLPTDTRYQDLQEDEIDVLFLYHLMKPTEEQLREMFQQEVTADTMQETLPEEMLKRKGWSDEMVRRIREDLPRSVR